MKKCLYIGQFTEPWQTEQYIAYALRQEGVHMTTLPEDAASDFQTLALAQLHDFVLFAKTDRHDLLQVLKKARVKTVTWFFDLCFDVPTDRPNAKNLGPEYLPAQFEADLIFTTDGGHAQNWLDLGITHHCIRQGIHEPEAVLGEKQFGVADILFIGSRYYTRRHNLMDFLLHTYGQRFAWYGDGADYPRVRGLDLNNVLASCKIVVGDSQPSPRYWSNRFYEILGRGGVLAHPYVEGIEEEFTPDEHFISFPYGDFETLKTKLDYYLAHPIALEQMRQAGFMQAKKFTYQDRAKQLLTYL